MIPTEAPKANTLALAASIDLVKSSACPVMRPRGWDKDLMSLALVPKLIFRFFPADFAAFWILFSKPVCTTGTLIGMTF